MRKLLLTEYLIAGIGAAPFFILLGLTGLMVCGPRLSLQEIERRVGAPVQSSSGPDARRFS